MLKTRIITALCILMVFLASLVFMPSSWFAAFVVCVLLAAAWEWGKLSSVTSSLLRALYCLFGLLTAFLLSRYVGLLSAVDSDRLLSAFLITTSWWALALLWVQGYPSSAVLWGNRWVRLMIGLMVLVPSGIALVFLHSQPQGVWLILLVVMIVATADIGAYFSGRAFGQRKLAKSVSPGKSWEGVIGGLLSCVLLSLFIAFVTEIKAWPVILMIIVPTALASVLGDLLESMVKRHSGVKDSGRLLPGHGGILDRIDGLTAAVPIFVLLILISGWQLPV